MLQTSETLGSFDFGLGDMFSLGRGRCQCSRLSCFLPVKPFELICCCHCCCCFPLAFVFVVLVENVGRLGERQPPESPGVRRLASVSSCGLGVQIHRTVDPPKLSSPMFVYFDKFIEMNRPQLNQARSLHKDLSVHAVAEPVCESLCLA